MISLVEALSFRAIRHTRQPLDRFQILVGPNASGKSTFLGIVDLMGWPTGGTTSPSPWRGCPRISVI